MVHVSTPVVLYPIPSIPRGHKSANQQSVRLSSLITFVDEAHRFFTITFCQVTHLALRDEY